jgi:hypothetical protein
MGFKRMMTDVALCVALLPGGATAAVAAPAEPLVVTQLADPDPNYVPPPNEQQPGTPWTRIDAAPVLDAAMQDFGRAIGQAALLQRRAGQAKCNSSAPVPADGAARWAWEANCRYERR